VASDPVKYRVALVVALALIATACTRTTEPTTTGPGGQVPAPPPPAKIAPVLRRAGSPVAPLTGQDVLFDTMTFSDKPIARIELWDSTELVDSYEPEEPESEVHHVWEWKPGTSGIHALVLRAIDVDDASATSFPQWMRVGEGSTDAAAQDQGANSAPEPGPQSQAPIPELAINTTTCIASLTLPAVQGTEGITVNAAVMGAPGFVPLPAVPGSGGTVDIPLGGSPVLVYSESYGTVKTNPGPPTIIDPPSGCADNGWSGNLTFHNGVLEADVNNAYLYVTYDGTTWDRVPAQDDAFIHPEVDGTFDFAPLLGPPQPDAPVSVEAWGWQGDTLTPLGRSTWSPPESTDSVGNQNSTVTPGLGPLFADSTLNWIVQNKLVTSGAICTFDPTAVEKAPSPYPVIPVTVVGETPASSPPTTAGSTIPVLPEPCTNIYSGQYNNTFRWLPLNSKGLTHAVAQVSTVPPPTEPTLDFPGLVMVQDVGIPASDESIDFELDFGPVIDPAATDTTSSGVSKIEWGQLNYQTMPGLGLDPQPDKTPVATETVVLTLPPSLQRSSDETRLTQERLWIRVVPFIGDQLAIGKSDPVVIDVLRQPPPAEQSDPTLPPSMSVEVRMTRPHLPNPSYGRCVRVVENPFGSKNPDPATTPWWYSDRGVEPPMFLGDPSKPDPWYQGFEKSAFIYQGVVKTHTGMVPGATVCAGKLSPPSKQWWEYIADAVKFVGWVWGMYLTVWDKLKDVAASVVAFATGCNAIAEATGKSEAEAKALCEGWSKTAITTALTVFAGIPPTLPKFKDLAEIGKGKLKDQLIKQMSDQGVFDNCAVLASECQKLAEKMADKILDEMQIAATNAVVQTATVGQQWILRIHPGIYVVPEPAGTLSPATFEITFTRSTDPTAPKPPASCNVTAHVFGDRTEYSWENYSTGKWIENQPVESVAVMAPESMQIDLSKLEPGESLKTVITAGNLVDWYPPGQDPILPKTPYNVKPQGWIFLGETGSGVASITTSLVGCVSASQTHIVDAHAWTEPWEVPYP